MTPIVTITFSPCIDKSSSVASLLPEKKLVCATPILAPGGGGVNVARAILQLGGNATAIFPSGGYTGKFFNHLLDEEKVPSIVIETAHETRENIIIRDLSSNQQYRFGMPAAPLSRKEYDLCLHALEGIEAIAFIVVSGSLPAGIPGNLFARLAEIANAKKAKLVVDVPGEALMNAFKENIFLLKPNLAELSFLAGVEKLYVNDAERVAKSLIQKTNCDMLVVSLGQDGALMATAFETYRVKAPVVDRKSTVGAGDSMVAGIVLALSKGMTPEQCLQYGVACGTAATLNEGTQLCLAEDVKFLLERIKASSQPALSSEE